MPADCDSIDDLPDLARRAGVEIEVDKDGVGVKLLTNALGFHHSFVSGAIARRAGQSAQALLRACNNKARDLHQVLDLTAGWGADALTLARHGKRVDLVEQNPLLCAILQYSRARLAAAGGEKIAARLQIECADAQTYLQRPECESRYDCIYLDPMFPPHRSGAKPGKEMQILQALTENRDIEACLELALRRARRRVVVKRPAKAARLGTREPDLVYREKTIRFDVYLT